MIIFLQFYFLQLCFTQKNPINVYQKVVALTGVVQIYGNVFSNANYTKMNDNFDEQLCNQTLSPCQDLIYNTTGIHGIQSYFLPYQEDSTSRPIRRSNQYNEFQNVDFSVGCLTKDKDYMYAATIRINFQNISLVKINLGVQKNNQIWKLDINYHTVFDMAVTDDGMLLFCLAKQYQNNTIVTQNVLTYDVSGQLPILLSTYTLKDSQDLGKLKISKDQHTLLFIQYKNNTTPPSNQTQALIETSTPNNTIIFAGIQCILYFDVQQCFQSIENQGQIVDIIIAPDHTYCLILGGGTNGTLSKKGFQNPKISESSFVTTYLNIPIGEKDSFQLIFRQTLLAILSNSQQKLLIRNQDQTANSNIQLSNVYDSFFQTSDQKSYVFTKKEQGYLTKQYQFLFLINQMPQGTTNQYFKQSIIQLFILFQVLFSTSCLMPFRNVTHIL